jgi:hypothetical protein
MRAMQQQARIDAQVLREELGRRDEQHSHSLKRLADSDAELLQSAYSELERAQQKQSELKPNEGVASPSWYRSTSRKCSIRRRR